MDQTGSSRTKRPGASQAGAEALAIEGLTFLASDPERLERFLSLSGLGPENLRKAASSPGFLVAVLDHIASDESLILAFSANGGHDPASVLKARDVLAGPSAEDFM